MPRFAGDVRDYVIFRADFKHAVDSRYGKRDAMSLLRTSLSGRPLELIKGIGSDYDAAWEHLQSWPKVFGTLQNYCMFLLFSSERVDLLKNKCLNQTPSPPPFNVDFGGILN